MMAHIIFKPINLSKMSIYERSVAAHYILLPKNMATLFAVFSAFFEILTTVICFTAHFILVPKNLAT